MTETKQPYRLSEPTREQVLRQIIDTLFELAEPGKIKNSLWAKYQSLDRPAFSDVQEQLTKLDALEEQADSALDAIEAAATEEEAVEQWHKLKSAQQAGQDLHKQLERLGYQVLIDAEQSFRHSASWRVEPTEHK